MAVDAQERMGARQAGRGGDAVATAFARLPAWRAAAAPPALASAGTGRRMLARAARDLAQEGARGTGLVAFVALFGAGAALYFVLPAEPPMLMVLVALFAGIGAVAVAGPGQWRIPALAALAVALGLFAGAFETWRAGTAMLGSQITTRLTGRIVAIEEREGGRVRLTIDVAATERPTLRFAPGRIRVTARAVPETLLPGAMVAGAVRLLPATGPARPGGYDFSFQSYFSGIGASGFFLTGPEEVAVPATAAPGARAAAAIERFRERLADHIRLRIAGSEGEIAAALVAGVRGGITEADNEALRRTGLAHFISISGLHMALVAAIVLVALRTGFAAFPGFAARHPVKKYAAAGALAAICGYIVISGQEVAAVRSFLMFAVMLVAVLFDRAALTMRNLAISAAIILAVAPHEIMGPSFQMSFGATAALIAAYAWHSERRAGRTADRRERGPTSRAFAAAAYFFGGLAATSIIAGLATTVFAVWHFQRVSPLGLVANLAAMPIVSLVVMPAALAGSLLVPLGLDAPFFAAMGWGLRVVMAITHWLSERSPLDAVGAVPAGAVLLLTVALALATVATTATIRLAALPLLLAGLVVAGMRDLPDALVSEDGRLTGVMMNGGRLAVNRPRPSAFTVANWSHALAVAGVARPDMNAAADLSEPLAASAPATAAQRRERPFGCAGGLCLARHARGAIIAHAADQSAAAGACGVAHVVIVDDATAGRPCGDASLPLVITKRDLALRGSAALWLDDPLRPRATFAIRETPRIWHQQRRFSREARGLPPYRRPVARDGGAPTP